MCSIVFIFHGRNIIMRFKTELHCHTSEMSPCSHETAEEVAKKYIDNGYDSLVVTNHFRRDVTDRFDGTWEYKIDCFFDAVDKVRDAAGGELEVIPGMEIGFPGVPNDYLVFGAEREKFYALPNVFDIGVGNFHNYTKENGMLLIQAHPLRFGMTIVSPDWLDGYEVFNGHPRHNAHNTIAEIWAKNFYKHKMIMTSGTDNHDSTMTPNGGITTENKIKTNDELLSVLRSGEYNLIRRSMGEADY